MKKEKNLLKKIIIIIFFTLLIMFTYAGIKIKADPSLSIKLRTEIRTKKYFLKVKNDAIIEDSKDESPWIYRYDVNAYSKEGESIKVSFYANKNLRKGAYICVYVLGSESKDNVYGVDTYEEVQESNVPKLAKEKIDKY